MSSLSSIPRQAGNKKTGGGGGGGGHSPQGSTLR